MEKYLDTLLSQIRCKKARPYIENEIKGHIECQIEENVANGMTLEEAEKSAVADMGDPIEVGVSLDRIHRPQIAWAMVAFVGMISLLGILVHFLIGLKFSSAANISDIYPQAILNNKNYFSGVLLGIMAMIIVYFIDYSVIAKYARVIGSIMLGVGVLGAWFGYTVHGGIYYIGIGYFKVLATVFFMLYVPIYGAILYKYRNTKWKGLIAAAIWMILPVVIALLVYNVYLALVLFVSLFLLLIIAVADGWFLIPRKTTVIALSSFLVLSPIFGIVVLLSGEMFLLEYQKARIHSFMHPGYDGNGAGYLASNLRNQLISSVMVGNNGKEILGASDTYTSDFILTYITGTYGILAGVLVCAVLAILIISIFVMATKQKNRVGMLMGCGCGILFLVNTGINILENLGYFPISQTFLPFLSAGRSNLIFSYILIGLVLSIYRYKNVYPKHMKSNQRQRAS